MDHHVKFLGQRRRLFRSEPVFGGVAPVGEEHQHPPGRVRLLQPVDAGSERRSDSGGVADHSRFEPVEVGEQPGVVQRRRREAVGELSEADKSDSVVGPRLDEAADFILCHFEPVFHLSGIDRPGELTAAGDALRNVERLHAPGHIHRQDDIDSL